MEVETAAETVSVTSSSSRLSDSSSSSSLISSDSALSVTWVSPSSLGKKWTSDLWSTEIFVVSRGEIGGRRKTKCIPCSDLKPLSSSKVAIDWGKGEMNLDGTTTAAHHARSCHSTLPRVSAWIQREKTEKEAILKKQQSQNANRKAVTVALFSSFSSMQFFSAVFRLFFQDLKSHGLDQWCRPVAAAYLRTGSDVRGQEEYKFNSPPHMRLTRAVVDWILLDGIPVSELDGEGFIQLMGIADPRYVVPSRTYIQHVCFRFSIRFRCIFSINILLFVFLSDLYSQSILGSEDKAKISSP